MSEPKNHHWVPQSYLRNFATPETRTNKRPMIWRFEKFQPERGARLRSIRRVCSRDDLYLPHIEAMLGHVETAVGKLWRPLNDGDADLSDVTLRNALGRFLGAMQLRSESMFERYERMFALRDKLGCLKSDYEPRDGLDARDAHKFFSQQIEKDLSRMAELYIKKPWVIIRCEFDTFVTSDSPLIHERKGRALGGPKTPDTTAIFPLGSRSVLAMDERLAASDNARQQGSADFARLVNSKIWRHCQRVLLTGRNPDDVSRELGLTSVRTTQ